MTRIALIGAAGRVGRLIVEVLPEFPNSALAAAVVSPTSQLVGSTVPLANQLSYSSDISAAVGIADVVIDFSKPDVSVAVAQACATATKPCLIATTGHDESQRAALVAAAKETALLIAPNTSVGIFVTTQMALLAAKLLGDSVDIEIVELHHRDKRDAPSGTANAIAATIGQQQRLQQVAHRDEKRRADELGVTSLRGGDVPGEHTIYFLGRGERIELTHRAADRAVFARGAIRLAERLAPLGPGLKQFVDLI